MRLPRTSTSPPRFPWVRWFCVPWRSSALRTSTFPRLRFTDPAARGSPPASGLRFAVRTRAHGQPPGCGSTRIARFALRYHRFLLRCRTVQFQPAPSVAHCTALQFAPPSFLLVFAGPYRVPRRTLRVCVHFALLLYLRFAAALVLFVVAFPHFVHTFLHVAGSTPFILPADCTVASS